MSKFAEAVEGLLDFLEKVGSIPPTKAVSVLEVRPDTPIDKQGRLIVRRNELREPSEYEERFEALMRSGLSWVNVGCIGIADDMLVVTVELPPSSVVSPGRTSVNYSGPSRVVLDNEWDATQVLVLR